MPVWIAGKNVGVGKVRDHISSHHGNHGSDDLDHQFEKSPQIVDIVKNAQHHNNDRTQQQRPVLSIQRNKQQRPQQKTQKNGKPAHQGDGPFVHPAIVLWYVHRPHLYRQVPYHRGKDQGNKEGYHQSGQHLPDQFQ